MWQNAIHRSAALLIILLASPVFLLPGCGNNDAASDGSTIVINPSSTTVTGMAADTTFNYTVTVRYADGTPYPKAIVHISGPFAVPRNVAGSFARYQFYYGPGGALGTNPLPINSGFDAQTDDYGNYQFSVVVFGTVGGAPNAFTDTISVSSGSAFGTIVLTFS